MEIDENATVAMFWNKKPIGIIRQRYTEPYKGVVVQSWVGWCFGERVSGGGLVETQFRMQHLANQRGIKSIYFDSGAGVDVIYTPRFEE